MDQEIVIQKTVDFVKKTLSNAEGSHDWFHIYRVWKNAITIGESEGADIFVVQLGALLHDIADYKFHDGDFSVGPRVAREFLEKMGVSQDIISHVIEIIETISFKGVGAEKPMMTLEGKVVRDSDRLDANGAIGIARCFSYGGHKGRALFNPEGTVKEHKDVESYLKGTDSSVHHFYEKLLQLKGLMLTETGIKMAEKRHEYMVQYLREFYAEWEGER